jgi:modulator of FtsH protease
VSTAYAPDEWTDLFVAVAGASAALLGLLFVAVSINLERILSYEGLPERALETLMLLLGVLVISILALMPAQSHVALGLELLGSAAVVAAIVFRLPTARVAEGREAPAGWRASRLAVRLMGTVPLLLGGLSLLVEAGGGLYWVAAGIVLAIIGRRRQRLGPAGRDPPLSITPGGPAGVPRVTDARLAA